MRGGSEPQCCEEHGDRKQPGNDQRDRVTVGGLLDHREEHRSERAASHCGSSESSADRTEVLDAEVARDLCCLDDSGGSGGNSDERTEDDRGDARRDEDAPEEAEAEQQH